ncbi:hypothetical protein F1C58_16615 (plasmid) [Glaciihabitans sp. INWT7]|uniref:hypothetical protein n=1 Tax=Glaciihabitans sp. INWT7 TaxID=2596912 RepID=UPI00162852E1|nr:hypothetical protein [Glaciihabitans sp. INWT7]QNE48680.1 hypothetical protein F1C58_16615 [Glaciihabitans sp. INWT7]
MARLQAFDLNALTAAAPKPGYDWSKRSRGARSGTVTVHLGDIATPLAQFLRDSESVVGCVAWITSTRLMDELVGKPVSLIVNKEWALRDGDKKPASVRIRANLARLTGGLRRQDFPAPLKSMAGASDEIDPVRCVGHSPRARTANNPLLHHKFVVRLAAGKPVAVWTGSFNFTVNAESSLENAISIEDPTIAAAYLAEWARVAAVSEPLNFKAGAAAPSWGPRRAAPAAPVATAAPASAKKKRPARVAPAKPKAAPGSSTAAPKLVAAKPRPKRPRRPAKKR